MHMSTHGSISAVSRAASSLTRSKWWYCSYLATSSVFSSVFTVFYCQGISLPVTLEEFMSYREPAKGRLGR